MSKQIALPVYLAKEHISDFCVTLPLCVILTEKKLLPWYYEKFVNICSTGREKALCFSGLGQKFMGFYDEIFNYYNIPSGTIDKKNICDLIIYQLQYAKNYCYIILDEYYVSCKKAFGEYHFVHQSLIYGYDFEERVFLAIAFNKNGQLDYLKYGYDEVENGFNIDILSDSVIFFKLWDNKEEYNFSPVRFIKQLENYINSSSDYPEHFITTSVSDTFRRYYGINAIKKTCRTFSNECGIDYNDFKNIHFLYEHKISINRTLEYINKQGYLRNANDTAMNEYREIVKQYLFLRNLALKTLCLCDIDAKFANQNKIKEKLEELIDREFFCLIEIIKSISFVTSNKSIDLLNVEIVLKDDIIGTFEYPYAKKFTFTWNDWKEIRTITVPKYNYIDIIVDSVEKCKLFSAYAQPSINYMYEAGFKCKTIELLVYSNVKINSNVLPIFYQNDLAYNKKIYASSSYDDKCSVNFSEYGYWRAAAQLTEYDGSDWLEVDFDEITKINTIVIGELDFSPRLIKYRILFLDETNLWRELLIHKFIKGQEQLHRFNTISTTKLRIEFLECQMEQNGYYEPIVNVFKVYCTGE